MKQTIILPDQQAQQIKSGALIMELLGDQPPDGYELKGAITNPDKGNAVAVFHMKKDTKCYTIDSVQNVRRITRNLQCLISLQYPVGLELGVRETWKIINRATDMDKEAKKYWLIEYSDGEQKYIPFKNYTQGFINLWRQSPATMPKPAIRRHVIITKNTVKRVQDVTPDELRQLGFASNKLHHSQYSGMLLQSGKDKFIDYFNSRFGEPRKHGKEYICYVYDMETALKTFGYAAEYCDGLIIKKRWKGKPLIIYLNPYLELFTVKEEK